MEVPVKSAQTLPPDSVPSGPTSNDVSLNPSVSATISVRPSGVSVIPFGIHPQMRVKVEAEVADVGTARSVDQHVVGTMPTERADIRVDGDRSVVVLPQHLVVEHRHHE